MKLVTALAAGLLFGVGLAVSGMLDPVRVLGFLDVAGSWDPSLAFVLGGAVAISGCGVALRSRMAQPAFAPDFDVPAAGRIDGRLLGGAAIFGLGWGLAGFCPGPALAALSTGAPGAVIFMLAMLAGMWLYKLAVGPTRPDDALPAVADAAK